MKNVYLVVVTLFFIVAGCDSAAHLETEEGPEVQSAIILGSGTYHHRFKFEDPDDLPGYKTPAITSKKGKLTVDVGTAQGTCVSAFIGIELRKQLGGGSESIVYSHGDILDNQGQAFNLDSYASAGDQFKLLVYGPVGVGSGSGSSGGCELRIYFEGND